MKLEELVNQKYNQLNENDKHILRYILNHTNTSYHLGISQLAAECNVSRSSVVRFAQRLGFTGYSEFRVFLKWQFEEQVVKGVTLTEDLNEDVQETLNYTKTKDFRDICELIDQAERIFVFGTGSLQLNCADELQRMFLIIHRHLYIIKAAKEFEILLQSLTAKELVIVISYSGDTPVIIPFCQSLRVKGVPFISITNLKNNKMAAMTPYNLYASSSETLISDSMSITSFSSFFLIGEILFRKYVDYLCNK